MDLKPFEQLASWAGESYCMPRFQHLGRLLQFLNLNVTKIFGSISSLNHHLGWPTRWKIARNLLSLTWSQETCLTHLPHPSTVPCDCYRLVNVDTFTSLLLGWRFFEVKGVMLEIVRETSLPQQKKTGRPLHHPKWKTTSLPPESHGAWKEDGPVTFPIALKHRLRLPTKNHEYRTQKRCWGWKILVFSLRHLSLCKNSAHIDIEGFLSFGKRVSLSLGGSFPTSSTNDPTVREIFLVVTWDISSQYNPTNHLSNRSVGGNLGNPTGAVNKKNRWLNLFVSRDLSCR